MKKMSKILRKELMKFMRNKKKICIYVLLVVWLCGIFFFSNQPGNVSIKQSDTIIYKITDIISTKNIEEKEYISIKWTFFVRKTAHFLEYFILGLIIYLVLDIKSIKHSLLWAIIISILCASLDEIHQLFVTGRTSQVFDVFIDTIGASIAIFFAHFIKKNK